MSSYQDIESRLKTVEDKLFFIMTAMRMKGMVTNGLLDANGQPSGQVLDQSLLEWYRLVKQQSIETIESAKVAPVENEKEQVNG